MKRSMLALSLMTVAATAACHEDRDMATGPADVSDVVPVGFVQPVLIRQPGTQPDEAEIVVRVVGRALSLGSYQGTVTFDTTALSFVSLSTPEHDGEFRIINGEGASGGRIRFAAFTAESLSDDVAFRFKVRIRGSWDAALLRATLDVVGDGGGAAIADGALRQSGSLLDGRTGAPVTSP
jgi:hypothetical protein